MENGIHQKQDSGAVSDAPSLMYPSLAFSHSRYGLIYLAAKKVGRSNPYINEHNGAKEILK